jgi:hypothetical protein
MCKTSILQDKIPGKGAVGDYYLTFHHSKGFNDPNLPAGVMDGKEPVTWQEATEQAIDYCKENNICLSYLCENGAMRRGANGQPYFFPLECRKIIALACLNLAQSN